MYVYTIVLTFQTMPSWRLPFLSHSFGARCSPTLGPSFSLRLSAHRPLWVWSCGSQGQTVGCHRMFQKLRWAPESWLVEGNKHRWYAQTAKNYTLVQGNPFNWNAKLLVYSFSCHYYVIEYTAAFPEIIHLNRKPLESIRTHIDDLSSFFRCCSWPCLAKKDDVVEPTQSSKKCHWLVITFKIFDLYSIYLDFRQFRKIHGTLLFKIRGPHCCPIYIRMKETG